MAQIITAPISDKIYTHDDALDFLKSCVPGGRVEIERLTNTNDDRLRKYSIYLMQNGVREYLSAISVYGLPFQAETIRNNIRQTIANAKKKNT